MMRLVMKLLEKMGRKYALVDFYGDVQMYRYYVVFPESHQAKGWMSWLPNVFIHEFVGEPGGRGPDGESPHAHPYNTLGVILRGGYTEVIDESVERVNTRFSTTYVRHTSYHRIKAVIPNTLTVFFHGFRKRKDWLIDYKQCDTLCRHCSSLGITSCVKSKGVAPFRPDFENDDLDSNAALTMMKVDGRFYEEIEKRRKKIRRLKRLPQNNAEKIDMLTEQHAKKFAREMKRER